MTHLVPAISEFKNYQVDFRDPFSQSMKNRGNKVQVVFDKVTTGISQKSHTLTTKAKPSGTADNSPAILPHTQLAATTDFSKRSDVVSLGHHVARIDTRLTITATLLTRFSKQVATSMALDPTSPTVLSARFAAIQNQPASTPGKHGAPFCARSKVRLPPRKRLQMLENSITPADETL